MSNPVLDRLASHIAQARAILFTGAGFSLDANTRSGNTLPTAGALTKELWEVAFPGEAFDGSGLQDTFEAASMQARNATTQLLKDRLDVDPRTLPEYYERWFSLPWYRVYTLNIDNLAEAADIAFDLPRPVSAISALTDPLVETAGSLQVVHLNGRLADVPDVTFTGRQYAERLSSPDVWYANLARELVGHPVVYVGTTLDEPPLWQYVEARGARPGRVAEIRPGSYLVSPKLPRAREVSLRQYNIDFIPCRGDQFAADVLSHLGDAGARGHKTLAQIKGGDSDPLDNVAGLVADSTGDEREFLLGREPRWSDLSSGYAVRRDFDDVIAQNFADGTRLLVITGTAGSGKSVAAMRLALALSATDKKVMRLNHDAGLRGQRVRRAVEAEKPDVLLIDDLDLLGDGAVGVLEDLLGAAGSPVVIAALRSSRYDGLGVGTFVAAEELAVEAVAPPMSDSDIEGLIDALGRANRLGVLKGRPVADQRRVLQDKCGRQLLVALIEATSGQRFDQKVESECQDLKAEAQLIYAIAALAGHFRIALSDAQILAAAGGDPTSSLRALDSLLRTHLLVRDKGGRIALRHRVIAERAVEYFRAERLVETPLRGIVFALATAARPVELRRSPQGRALIRIISHRVLIEFLRRPAGNKPEPDQAAIRGIYEEIEAVLSHDFHFWLQRGAFETEAGNIDLARNFLEQARGIAPEDPYVRLQWAYATLKRAAREPNDPLSRERAQAAFDELEESIAQRGRRDAYPFHVYGSQGLAWANRAPLTLEERTSLLMVLRRVVNEGLDLHPARRDLLQLQKDLEAAYLRIATV